MQPDDQDRQEAAEDDLEKLRLFVELYAVKYGAYPTRLERLLDFGPKKRASLLRELPRAPWGRAYVYLPSKGTDLPRALCYGRDGAPGGTGYRGRQVKTGSPATLRDMKLAKETQPIRTRSKTGQLRQTAVLALGALTLACSPKSEASGDVAAAESQAEVPADATPEAFETEAAGAILEKQREVARLRLQSLRTASQQYALHAGRFPESLEEMLEVSPDSGRAVLQELPTDPWGNAFGYVASEEGGPPRLICYGRDGQPGGTGPDEDIE